MGGVGCDCFVCDSNRPYYQVYFNIFYSFLRPIAGVINFCPDQFPFFSDERNIRIGIHPHTGENYRIGFRVSSVGRCFDH